MANYVLTIQIDPNSLNSALKKFQAALWGGSPQQASSNPFGKLQTILTDMQKAFSGKGGKLAALGLMSIGIMGIFELMKKIAGSVIDASPMLQAMMGLLNTGIMFMLRPIGDFIGFLLRPILLIFLRYIALPFYRYMAPWAQRYGTVIGDGLAKFLSSAIGFFQDPAGSLKAAFESLPDTVRKIIDIVFPIAGILDLLTHLDLVTKAFGSLSDLIDSSFSATWAWFKSFWDDVAGGIQTVVDAWNQVWSFFSGIIGGIETLFSGWDKVWAFFDGVGKDIGGVLTTIWNAIVGTFKLFANGLIGAWNWFADVISRLSLGLIKLPPLKPMARGGIISEPVVGIGQRTGQGYLLGENGAEQVTPIGRGGGGGVTINIYGGDTTQIRNTVLQVLQESSARRRRI